MVQARRLMNSTSAIQERRSFADYYQRYFEQHRIIYAWAIAADFTQWMLVPTM
jgi:hypothetical protein